jgi:hypothetical protein
MVKSVAEQFTETLAAVLNGRTRVTLLCGSGCQGAYAELLALGADQPVAIAAGLSRTAPAATAHTAPAKPPRCG